MIELIESATKELLVPAEVDIDDFGRVFHQIIGADIDYADIFLQAMQSESWVLEDSIIKSGSFNLSRGLGVRAVSGEKTGFAYVDDINLKQLEQAAQASRSIAKLDAGSFALSKPQSLIPIPKLYVVDNPIASIEAEIKTTLLQEIDQFTRSLDPRIIQVIVSLSGQHEVMMVAASDGTLAADIRPLVRFNVSVIIESHGKRESASHGGGGRYTYHEILANDAALAKSFAKEAVRQAQVVLEADPAPVGMMPVVVGPGWPGVLLHEAVGHGLEGDFNRKGTSAYSGSMGEMVASSLCTIVDDGTLSSRRGSISLDDEGTPSACTVLIDKGRLVNYMQDKVNARLMNMKPTGNGRRESYAALPMPRMTNTYMLPGEHVPEEIIASVKKGLYAVNFSGGQVDITSGKFVFSASEAYLIENGKITRPVKGAMLIGNGPDAMRKVSMVGNDLRLDEGVGVCGKEGQSVPVGVGQPTLKLDELTVGGTQMG